MKVEVDKRTNKREIKYKSDTGRDMGFFSKLVNLKEAFMVILENIHLSFGQVKQVCIFADQITICKTFCYKQCSII